MSSPTPPSNPSPLAIGRTFLKQYYHVLTTTPEMIYKFYRPSSVLSHGEGSNPTVPATLESLGLSAKTDLKDRFFSWADSSGDPVRFELEHGAIDAQESVGGGVLLVVTGHMYLGNSRKPFCHTFFLNVFSAENSPKRQYYVHNDVLRFLQEEAPLTESSLTSVAEGDEENVVSEEPVPVIDEQPAKEEEKDQVHPEPNDAVESEVESAGDDVAAAAVAEPVAKSALPEEYIEGVEETKEEPAEEIEEATTEAPDVKEEEPKESAPSKPKPPPGSWASLVASGGGNGAAAAPAKTAPVVKKQAAPAPKKEKAPPQEEQPIKKEKEIKKVPDNTMQKGVDTKPRGRRDPDFTLVIKNVQDGVKEADVRLVFEPFAIQTNTKIVGITVSQRGLAFVDYDSAAPVLAALEKKDSFVLNGKSVNIDQKTNDNKNRGRGGKDANTANRSNGQRSDGQRSGRSNSNGQDNKNNTSSKEGPRNGGGKNNGGKGGESGGSGGK